MNSQSSPTMLLEAGEGELIQSLQKSQLRLIVVRHGEAEHNLKNMMTSSRSPGIFLTKSGEDQVARLAKELAKENVKTIFTSPLYRTLQTTHILAKQLDVPHTDIVIDERLREQFFGEGENGTYREYLTYFDHPDDYFSRGAPGGETGLELRRRTKDFLSSLSHKRKNCTVLLITHGNNCCHMSDFFNGPLTDIPKPGELRVYDFQGEPVS